MGQYCVLRIGQERQQPRVNPRDRRLWDELQSRDWRQPCREKGTCSLRHNWVSVSDLPLLTMRLGKSFHGSGHQIFYWGASNDLCLKGMT